MTMNIRLLKCGLFAGGVLGAVLFTAVAATDKDEQAKLESKAKISRAKAEKTALTKVPGGTIKEGELEEEDGKLIWSFDIGSPNSPDITEVQVNATTGKIESVEKETPADQAKEKAADLKEKKSRTGKSEKEDGNDKAESKSK